MRCWAGCAPTSVWLRQWACVTVHFNNVPFEVFVTYFRNVDFTMSSTRVVDTVNNPPSRFRMLQRRVDASINFTHVCTQCAKCAMYEMCACICVHMSLRCVVAGIHADVRRGPLVCSWMASPSLPCFASLHVSVSSQICGSTCTHMYYARH